jgi:hypothetical protein
VVFECGTVLLVAVRPPTIARCPAAAAYAGRVRTRGPGPLWWTWYAFGGKLPDRYADLFQQTDFLGDINNLPHAHYGYLMATVGQIDTVSVCHGGNASQGQTPRMITAITLDWWG